MMETLRKLGPAKLGALGGVALLLLGFFAFLAMRLSSPDMALLYADLDPADSSHIVEKLDQMGVPYQLGADGTSIRVPADQALKLRMSMAQEGLPGGGSIGYEIFDQQQPLGTTSFEQQVNKLRAMEGELARTIKTIDLVKNARVHLVIPERQLFAKEQPSPSASIILTMAGGAVLDKQQVSAIEHLVAAAVPGLKPNAVSIVDSTGTLLAPGNGDSDDGLSGSAEEARLSYENKIRRSIEELLQRTLGYGKIRAEVTADLDFDRVTTNSETYNPDGQVVRSTQTVEEKNDSSDAQASDQVTVANNLPNPTGGSGGGGTTSASRSQRTEETVNYEISKETQVHIRETGQVKKLSVAVLVDGTYTAAADGTTAYAPRSAEELDQIGKLVKSAIGYDEKRGDTVEVVNMRFADNAELGSDASAGLFMGFSRSDLVRIVEMLVLALLGALAIMFGVRPILNRLLSPSRPEVQAQITDQSVQAALPAPDGTAALTGPTTTDEIERMIDIGQIEGQVRASSIRKISELVSKHPEEAVGIMRGWMYQDS
ncbi:MAG TPA: flagellar basal-body MS-ring/collar protein FliF [Hypericibacter adhaerens]|uniref:flagellar basal-body MS-ring/collar protein FliF n=1 Tax=Hypericibacter adhaerens TaxID=2602016 RepID=UPI002C6AF523|nr:flagellar basal-body MS-ring/collar protein FliF [Hypericibacter adhaerens]HWA45906.1 flagellar basal-body MS-ring/collar protein FliF [Hypericibacter adhaerens]